MAPNTPHLPKAVFNDWHQECLGSPSPHQQGLGPAWAVLVAAEILHLLGPGRVLQSSWAAVAPNKVFCTSGGGSKTVQSIPSSQCPAQGGFGSGSGSFLMHWCVWRGWGLQENAVVESPACLYCTIRDLLLKRYNYNSRQTQHFLK